MISNSLNEKVARVAQLSQDLPQTVMGISYNLLDEKNSREEKLTYLNQLKLTALIFLSAVNEVDKEFTDET